MYKPPEVAKAGAIRKKRNEFEAEVAKISEAYKSRRREEAKLQAIKDARARARYQRQNSGGKRY